MIRTGCVIINYNDSKRVVALAKQLVDYCFFENIVIVDNNSNNENIEIIKNILNKYLNVKIITNAENQGYNRGTNTGLFYLASVGCDYAFSINSDIDVSKDTLQALVDVLQQHPDYAASGALMIEKGRFYNGFFEYPTIHSVVLDNLGLSKKRHDEIREKNEFVKVDVIRSSLCCFRFEAIKKVGFFDPNTFLYFGEAILSFKLRDAGYSEGVLFNRTYYHNHIYSNRVMNAYKICYQDAYYAFKNYFGLTMIGKIRMNLSYHIGKILRILVGKK